MVDQDQSGSAWQKARTWLGPTLGWVDTQVRPSRAIAIAGTYQVFTGDSVIFVNVPGLVTLLLPDVRLWIQEPAYQPATGFERAIWIKDLGGNAASFPITVSPFSGQTIDLLGTPFQVVVNRQLIRLYPLNDQTGWWVG
jgi:hypothetical protein